MRHRIAFALALALVLALGLVPSIPLGVGFRPLPIRSSARTLGCGRMARPVSRHS